MDAGHFVGNQGRKSVSVSEPVVPEQGVSAPASAAEGAGRETPAPSSAILNQQFTTLNSLRRARTWVDVYLVTGTCLHGQIRSFDSNMLLLQTRSGDIALYHHAISSVMRAQKRAAGAKGPGSRKPVSARGAPGGRGAPGRGQDEAPAPARIWHDRGEPPRERSRDSDGIRIEGGRLTAGGRLSAPRRTVTPPAGVVVVRHKRVRTIVKPEDEH